jgi:predicted DNA-binding ArsR family transcriptional regulator
MEDFSKRTAKDIYLEYVNDWLTIDAMAEHYGIEPQQLGLLLSMVKYEE